MIIDKGSKSKRGITIPKIKQESGIYQIKNLRNNKVYIGQSAQLLRRLKNHESELQSGCHKITELQELYNESKSKSIEVSILKYCACSDLSFYESFFICSNNSIVDGYNEKIPIYKFNFFPHRLRSIQSFNALEKTILCFFEKEVYKMGFFDEHISYSFRYLSQRLSINIYLIRHLVLRISNQNEYNFDKYGVSVLYYQHFYHEYKPENSTFEVVGWYQECSRYHVMLDKII